MDLTKDLKDALELAARIASGKYEPEELERFNRFLHSADSDQINQVLDAYKVALDNQDRPDLLVRSDFMDRLRALRPESIPTASETPVLQLKLKTAWLRWASVAAAILISFSTYFYFSNKNEKPAVIAHVPTDVKAPQTNRATITLSGGQNIFLDSAANGQLALQNNIKLIKTSEGKISYNGSQPGQTAALIYNTLTNPKGSKVIDMELADGTHVWLNAGSSLTYPVAFAGHERNVEITGEAYFEVTHNAAMPFTVKKLHDDAKVQVLGTHFNVNAYDDETSIRITLLEGSVKVSKGNHMSLIKPGQQAAISNKEIKINNDIDLEEVMAWKNGKFQFGDASDIATIMRQISRWYDVDVEYQGNISEHIGGSIPRDVNASQVFKMLETTGTVKFKIEGRKVTVMPAAP
jgi:transmembrane sensor